MTAHPAVAELLDWYRVAARDLPWRRTVDPYALLVSEVMLQQTQVARVVPRYLQWLERWPTADALAAAPLADVLRAWVGLGYNRRAVRLWEACRVVAAEGWPPRLEDLPGVGPYTAAAVGSFAFGHQTPAVDTNAARVLARWRLGSAQALLPKSRSAEFNQAMMELGATLCRAHEARCERCPVSSCRSRGRPARRARRGGQSGQRFVDTDRYARGRIVAALAVGDPAPADLGPERFERAVRGLERDGLVIRDASGLSLP